MKKKGSISDYSASRDNAIVSCYRRAIRSCSVIDLDQVMRCVVKQPCERFYVSEERAAYVISAMMRGLPILETMLETKRRMFTEIYRRVVALRTARPKTSLLQLTTEVVNSPAPEFYISPRYAKDRLFAARHTK